MQTAKNPGVQTCVFLNWWTIDIVGQKNKRQGCCAFAASLVTGQDLFGWSYIHLHLTRKPPPASTHISAQEKRVFCWVLRPVYRRGSSGVTSHQTQGPLKHIWVAPAVPRAIRMLTERREPEQHKKNGFSWCKIQDLQKQCFSCQKGEILFV